MADTNRMSLPRSVAFEVLLSRFFYDADEEVGPFLELSPEVVSSSRGGLEEIPEEFLAFSLEQELYVVPIAAVREILKVPAITEVPRGDEHLVGLTNVRGEMLPVYDIKHRLGMSATTAQFRKTSDAPRSARVVLVKDPLGDAGLLVDGVVGVVKLTLSKLEQAPQLGVERNCIAGLSRQGDALYILLDLEQALS